VYPYTIGANVGTTITAFLASLAVLAQVDPVTGAAIGRLGFTAALVHLLFNLHGALVFYPLRMIPIRAAKWYAGLAGEKPRYAAFFIIGVFFVAPTVVILLMQVF
jgi:sodium-dependent phosphate cotransporter